MLFKVFHTNKDIKFTWDTAAASSNSLSVKSEGTDYTFQCCTANETSERLVNDSQKSQLLVRSIRRKMEQEFEKFRWIRLGSTFVIDRENTLCLDISYQDGRLCILPCLISSIFESIQDSLQVGELDGFLAPNAIPARIFSNEIKGSQIMVQVDRLRFLYPSRLVFVRKQSESQFDDPLDLMLINDLAITKSSKLVRQNDEIDDDDEDLVIKKRSSLPTPITYCNVFSPQYFASTPFAYSPSPMGEVISPMYSPGGVGPDFRSPPPTSPYFKIGNAQSLHNSAPANNDDEMKGINYGNDMPTQWQPLDIDIECLSDATYGPDGFDYTPNSSPGKFRFKAKFLRDDFAQFIPTVDSQYVTTNYAENEFNFQRSLDSCATKLPLKLWVTEARLKSINSDTCKKLRHERLSSSLGIKIKSQFEKIVGEMSLIDLQEFDVDGKYC